MTAATVRIEPKAHASLTEIARAKHIPLIEALSFAVERCRRETFLEGVAADFAAFRERDPEGWAEDLAESDLWDTTSADGLEVE